MHCSEESLDSRTDFSLLQQTASGDRSAFEVFVERHQAAVFRHASCLAICRQDAEDLLQETFLCALKGCGQFRGDGSGRAWLFHITRNAALRRVAQSHAIAQENDALEDLAQKAGWGSRNPETLAMLAEDRDRLSRALAALPAEEREILLLREWEKLSGDETSTLLQISLPAMKGRLHRARIRLAALLRVAEQGKEGHSRGR